VRTLTRDLNVSTSANELVRQLTCRESHAFPKIRFGWNLYSSKLAKIHELAMTQNVLITGGAGFIGAHLAKELLKHGYYVHVLDNLSPQVHGPERQRPAYLSTDVELIVGDIRNPEILSRALDRIDAVVHFVALVGVGQSMYQISEY